MLNNSEANSVSTSTKELWYLPSFEFPAGKSLITELPKCKGDSTILKIPYTGTINYTVTVKGTNPYSFGNNPILTNFPYESINGTRYYIAKAKLDPGTYQLVVEYKEGSGTTCAFESDPFIVPTIPDFKINTISYPSQVDSYKIPTIGGTGQALLKISGCSSQTVTVKAGTLSFIKSMSNRTSTIVGGVTYYSGDVTIDLAAGSYTISVISATGCTSNTLSGITMNQPSPIAFTVEPQSPKCFGDKGSVLLKNISGGITPYSYKLDGGSAQSLSSPPDPIENLAPGYHTVTVSDNYQNTMTKAFTINAAPSAVTIVSSVTPPSIHGSSDGSLTIAASGGTPPYQYSLTGNNDYTSGNYFNNLSAGNKTIYVKDSNAC
ncbi:MAG: SprB repeat-containing protein, partial [Dysgonamonadaceae bacterium]|nr:SprB repeat-containing protein [Dysgonamonadaceae bacterium]